MDCQSTVTILAKRAMRSQAQRQAPSRAQNRSSSDEGVQCWTGITKTFTDHAKRMKDRYTAAKAGKRKLMPYFSGSLGEGTVARFDSRLIVFQIAGDTSMLAKVYLQPRVAESRSNVLQVRNATVPEWLGPVSQPEY